MRLTTTTLIALSLFLAGCACGGAPVGPTAQAAPAAPSAMATQVTHDGCSIRGGMECGGKALGAIDLELPSPAGLIQAARDWFGLTTGQPAPFAGQRAAPSPAPDGCWIDPKTGLMFVPNK